MKVVEGIDLYICFHLLLKYSNYLILRYTEKVTEATVANSQGLALPCAFLAFSPLFTLSSKISQLQPTDPVPPPCPRHHHFQICVPPSHILAMWAPRRDFNVLSTFRIVGRPSCASRFSYVPGAYVFWEDFNVELIPSPHH